MAGTNASLFLSDADFLILCDDDGPFIRRIVDGVASDWGLDGVTPHVVSGTVGNCGSGATDSGGCGGILTVELCDDNEIFLKHIVRDCEGVVVDTFTTEIDGETPYTPVGVVGICSNEVDEVVAQVVDLDGTTWSIGDVTGNLLSISIAVVVGASDNEIDIGDVPISNLPSGFAANWSIESNGQILTNVTGIDPGTGGRIIVSWTETGV